MRIGDIKKYLNSLPKSYDDYELVVRDLEVTEDGDIDAYDCDICMFVTDEEREVVCFMDEESTAIFSDFMDV